MGNNPVETFLWLGGGPLLLIIAFYMIRKVWREYRLDKFNHEWDRRLDAS